MPLVKPAEQIEELERQWTLTYKGLRSYFRATGIKQADGSTLAKNVSNRGLGALEKRQEAMGRALAAMAKHVANENGRRAFNDALEAYASEAHKGLLAVRRYQVRGERWVRARQNAQNKALGYLRGWKREDVLRADVADDVRQYLFDHNADKALRALFVRVFRELGRVDVADALDAVDAGTVAAPPTLEECSAITPTSRASILARLKCCVVSAMQAHDVKRGEVKIARVQNSGRAIVVMAGGRRGVFVGSMKGDAWRVTCTRIEQFIASLSRGKPSDDMNETHVRPPMPATASAKMLLAQMGRTPEDTTLRELIEYAAGKFTLKSADQAKLRSEHHRLVLAAMDASLMVSADVMQEYGIKPRIVDEAPTETTEAVATPSEADVREVEGIAALPLKQAEGVVKAREAEANAAVKNKNTASVASGARVLGVSHSHGEVAKVAAINDARDAATRVGLLHYTLGMNMPLHESKGLDAIDPARVNNFWVYYAHGHMKEAREFAEVYGSLLYDELNARGRVTKARYVDVSRRLGYTDDEIRVWLLAGRLRTAFQAHKQAVEKAAKGAPLAPADAAKGPAPAAPAAKLKTPDAAPLTREWEQKGGKLFGSVELRWARIRAGEGERFIEVSLAARPSAGTTKSLVDSAYKLVTSSAEARGDGAPFWRANADSQDAAAALRAGFPDAPVGASPPAAPPPVEPPAPPPAAPEPSPDGEVSPYLRASLYPTTPETTLKAYAKVLDAWSGAVITPRAQQQSADDIAVEFGTETQAERALAIVPAVATATRKGRWVHLVFAEKTPQRSEEVAPAAPLDNSSQGGAIAARHAETLARFRGALAVAETIPAKELATVAAPVAPAPLVTELAKGGSRTLASTVYYDVRDLQGGAPLAVLVTPHNGTVEGIRRAAEALQARATSEYPDLGVAASRMIATGPDGKAGWAVSPNLEHVNPVGTDAARYTLGDLEAAPVEARAAVFVEELMASGQKLTADSIAEALSKEINARPDRLHESRKFRTLVLEELTRLGVEAANPTPAAASCKGGLCETPWSNDLNWTRVVSHTRPDGAVVAIEREGSYYRVTLRRDGQRVMPPMDALKGVYPTMWFLRLASEPVDLAPALISDVKAALAKMHGLKKAERAEFEALIGAGRPRALAMKLDGMTSRKGGDGLGDVIASLKRAAEQAEAALPTALYAQVEAASPTGGKRPAAPVAPEPPAVAAPPPAAPAESSDDALLAALDDAFAETPSTPSAPPVASVTPVAPAPPAASAKSAAQSVMEKLKARGIAVKVKSE